MVPRGSRRAGRGAICTGVGEARTATKGQRRTQGQATEGRPGGRGQAHRTAEPTGGRPAWTPFVPPPGRLPLPRPQRASGRAGEQGREAAGEEECPGDGTK